MSPRLPLWSGLSRPSTTSLVEACVQDVDARHKGEHDGEDVILGRSAAQTRESRAGDARGKPEHDGALNA